MFFSQRPVCFQLLGIARPYFDLRGGPFDFMKVVGCQFVCGGANVFFQTTLAGAHLATATTGPRTVPVRSSIAGGKAQECSRPPRPSDVLRAGTARAPVGVSRCAALAVDIYEPSTGQWTKGPDLPAGKHKGFSCSSSTNAP